MQKRIQELSQQACLADKKLAAAGLELTQGGEPTFLPIQPEGVEWSVGAIGPQKLPMARKMARHLAQGRFAGGLILLSSGKLYPGEPLPRWKLGLYNYKGQDRLWHDPDLIKLDQDDSRRCDDGMANRLALDIAEALGRKEICLEAFEDLGEQMRMAAALEKPSPWPMFDPSKGQFQNPELTPNQWKDWLALCKPSAWVIPVLCEDDVYKIIDWPREMTDSLIMVSGDSPAGLRLPLNRLPEDVSRTALTVEVKQGELWIFLPPCTSGRAFRSLVAKIEAVLSKAKLPPVVLWGYAPPEEEGLLSLGLTADPGVLEVNLPPADNWPEFEACILSIYEAAEKVGLRGSKFQLSGREVGTGGGAHILFGGSTLKRNPFLHRPSLATSLIRFLQHHPSLSYAFTGMFMGPSSQAPRIDETVYEAPYEIEIALAALDSMPTPADLVLMGGILRNLLLDWNGNTHRAEVSVDKFHNGTLPSSSLGLIELRAFEMQPEPSMFLAVNALLRCLIAAFAEQPFVHPLVSWGKTLHDRFTLPWFLREDLGSVLEYLSDQGFEFKLEWFKPIFDFRFPEIHTFETDTFICRIRQAIEPWPVMGEMSGPTGTTSRTVDASTDRIECLVEMKNESERIPIVTVNGIPLTLKSVQESHFLAGVRYRLFDNPFGLHPHIPSHCPLNFCFFDAQERKHLGGFEYHNWRRGPDGYESIPADASEARRRVEERIVIKQREPAMETEPWSSETSLNMENEWVLDLRKLSPVSK